MSDAYPTPAHRWFDQVWNLGNETAIDEMLSDDVVAHGLEGNADRPLHGPEGFNPYFRRVREAFPDMHVVVAETVTEGDLLAVRCEITGTHLGNSLGVLATGRTVRFAGIAMVRIRDGRFVEAWNHFDFATLYRQLAPDPDDPGPGV